MSIDVTVIDNGDHTCIVWLPSDLKPIPDCRGFAVRRLKNGKEDYLHGSVGFSDGEKLDRANPWKFPVQRYMWWDYFVTPGDTVQYSVVPVTGKAGHLTLAHDMASELTPEMKVTGQRTPHVAAYFNKGIVAAQWVSRALAAEPKGAKLKELIVQEGDKLRNALSGLLRPQILSLLDETHKNKGKIFAALYELDDPELIAGLTALGKDCNLILANGAFKPPDNDENKDIRAKLKSKIRIYDRIVKSPHFGHNKFVVFCDSAGKPQKVLTGSTNWTASGLCTQANNGLIIDDPGVAADYLDAWNRIHAAGNAYPASLAAANSKSKTFDVDGGNVTPWFVPTQNVEDLDFARKLINGARQGILFLFFNPGTFQPDSSPEKWTLLQNILARHHEENNAYYDPNLYIKGVVNQQIAMLTNDTPPAKGVKPPAELMDPAAATNSVALFTSGNQPPQRLDHDVLVPSNIKSQFHDWEKELLGASLVNIHSKVIVIDPFGEHPVVMTGSHNLGYKASSENDDNLAIIEGNAPLAAAYAINIIAIYQTYRWNSHVEQHRKDASFWHGLQDSDKWQTGYLSGEHLAEIRFFMGETETSVAGILPERTYPIHAVSTARAPKKKHAVT